MATRSTIWIKNEKGFKGIYCHNDGYSAGVGKTLKEHYTDVKKINDLINLGSISSLGKNSEIPKGFKHYFDEPLKDITVAYHRDRGEPLKIYKAKDLKESRKYFEAYNYIFDTEFDKWEEIR